MSDKIDVSVVIPTKNEEISIAQFISWAFEGFKNADVTGEIILLDSSSDNTPTIASQLGARVINVRESGLGNAYRKGRGMAEGRFLILGDADCTYDFRDIAPFLNKLNEGFDLVVGNRFSGTIEKGAMPKLHQYFGSPITSWIFKRVLGLPTGDIHCGIRALRADLYNQLPFLERGWEYASEMIVAARNMNARISEIPVKFYRAPAGRLSHYKRGSWLAPFKSGWGTLRVTATYSFDRLLAIPGIFVSLFALSALILGTLSNGAFQEITSLGVFGGAVILAISIMGILMASIGILTSFIYFGERSVWKRIGTTKFAELALGFFALITIGLCSAMFRLSIAWFTSELSADFTSENGVGIYEFYSWVGVFFASAGLMIVSTVGNHLRKLNGAFE